MHSDASLAKLFREHGDRWEIEKVQRGTEWVAVQRDTSGDYIRVLAAHDIGALPYHIRHAEDAVPEEHEPANDR